MANLKTVVKVGIHTIQIEADSPKELIEELQYWKDLAKGAEDEEAELYFRDVGGYKYYGFRRLSDGAEVNFGQLKKPDDKDKALFVYGPYSDGYKGYEKYVPEKRK